MVDRPEDVRGAIDVETGRERVLRGQALDDRALVGVVLALDPVQSFSISGSLGAAARMTSIDHSDTQLAGT